jgi:hypothetical protein
MSSFTVPTQQPMTNKALGHSSTGRLAYRRRRAGLDGAISVIPKYWMQAMIWWLQ